MDGNDWENVLTNDLPNLKIFRCMMAISFGDPDDVKPKMDSLLCSFQSPFWVENHQWFFRFHSKSKTRGRYYILYHSLPCAFSHSSGTEEHLWSVSTLPGETDYWPPDSIDKLLDNSACSVNTLRSMELSKLDQLYGDQTTIFQQPFTRWSRIREIFRLNQNGLETVLLCEDKLVNLLNAMLFVPYLDITDLTPRFRVLVELSVELPFDKDFSEFIPRLDQLTSLKVTLSINYSNGSDLDVLLNQAPNLHSLSVVFFTAPVLESFLTADIEHASIRELSFGRYGVQRRAMCSIFSFDIRQTMSNS
jgi:hypothetical protein